MDDLKKNLVDLLQLGNEVEKDIIPVLRNIDNDNVAIQEFKFELNEEETVKLMSIRKRDLLESKLPILLLAFQNIMTNKRLQKQYVMEYVEKGYNVVLVENTIYEQINNLEAFNEMGLLFWKYYIKACKIGLAYAKENMEYSSLNLLGLSGAGAASLVYAILYNEKFDNIVLIDSVVDFDFMFDRGLYRRYFSHLKFFQEIDKKEDDVKTIVYNRYPEMKVMNPAVLIPHLNYINMLLINSRGEIFEHPVQTIMNDENCKNVSNVVYDSILLNQLSDTVFKDVDKWFENKV